jgi:hypothetical protein
VKTVILQPATDLIVGWQQFPNDGLAHHLKIDEGFAGQDGDTTYLFTTGGSITEKIGFDPLPHDFKQSIAFRLKGYAKSDSAATTLGIGIDVDGAQYFDLTAGWDFSALPLNTWQPLSITMTAVPTVFAGSVLSFFTNSFTDPGKFVFLTQLQLEVDYLEQIRPKAIPVAVVSKANPTGPRPSAMGAVTGPSSTPAATTPRALPSAVVPEGEPE